MENFAIRSPRFSSNETAVLLIIWGKPGIVENAMPSEKEHAFPYYEMISQELFYHGYIRSAKAVANKIKALISKFNSTKKEIGNEKNPKNMWEFYEDVGKIVRLAAQIREKSRLSISDNSSDEALESFDSEKAVSTSATSDKTPQTVSHHESNADPEENLLNATTGVMQFQQASPLIKDLVPELASSINPTPKDISTGLRPTPTCRVVPRVIMPAPYYVGKSTGQILKVGMQNDQAVGGRPVNISGRLAMLNCKLVPVFSTRIPGALQTTIQNKASNAFKENPNDKDDKLQNSVREVRDLVKTIVNIDQQRMEVEKDRFEYEKLVGDKILNLLGQLVSKEDDKENI